MVAHTVLNTMRSNEAVKYHSEIMKAMKSIARKREEK